MAGQRISATLDTKEFRIAARKVPGLLKTGMRFAFESHGDAMIDAMDRRFTGQLSGPGRTNSSLDRLVNRTGSLRRSLASRVDTPSGELRLRVTIGNARTASYVFTQEFGATIRPKRAKYLTIPLPANLTTAGRVRFKSPRDVEDGFFVMTKKKNLLFGRSKKNGDFEALFILKKRVDIPARLGFRKTWRSPAMRADRDQRIDAALRQVLRIAKLKQ